MKLIAVFVLLVFLAVAGVFVAILNTAIAPDLGPCACSMAPTATAVV